MTGEPVRDLGVDNFGQPAKSVPVLNRRDIKELLPHRFPMLLVDQVLTVNEQSSTAVSQLKIRWWHTLGHFGIFPGCHIVEAVGQSGILLFHLLNPSSTEGKVAFLRKAKNATFNSLVRPGTILMLETTIKNFRADSESGAIMVSFSGRALVAGDEVASVGEFILVFSDGKEG